MVVAVTVAAVSSGKPCWQVPFDIRGVNARDGGLGGTKLEVFELCSSRLINLGLFEASMVENVGAAFPHCALGDEPTGSRQARRQVCPGDRKKPQTPNPKP